MLPPHSGLPPPGSPNTQQTSRSFLQTQHPVAQLAADHSPGVCSVQSAADIHTQSTLSLLWCPDTPPNRIQPSAGLHLGKPRPQQGTHTKLCELVIPFILPLSPACRLHVTCSQEGLHLPACEPRRQGRLTAGVRSQGGHRGLAGLSLSPHSRRDISETKALLGELLPFPPAPASLKHTPRVQLYKSCSPFPYHN